jgi:hypothetical protein
VLVWVWANKSHCCLSGVSVGVGQKKSVLLVWVSVGVSQQKSLLLVWVSVGVGQPVTAACPVLVWVWTNQSHSHVLV